MRSLTWRRFFAWLAAGSALVAAGIVMLCAPTRLERDLAELPASERRALYERTLETLHTTCGLARGAEVASFCREQASFITHFPECDSACRELAARFTSRPSR